MRSPRLLWIVNHRTLLKAEVPLIQQSGYEVFVPKIVPDDAEYRSGAVTYEFDGGLSLPQAALSILNEHDFYQRSWSPTITSLINAQFDVVVSSVSGYIRPLSEAVRKFKGLVVARVFGREHPRRYSEFFVPPTIAPPLSAIAEMGGRFVFGQAFDNLAEIEDSPLSQRGHTITVPIPTFVYERAGTWVGDREQAVFVCPSIMESSYYQAQYQGIKRHFGDMPHRIFGRQGGPVGDEAVLAYLSDAELLDLYASSAVFVYPSAEPRHVHYSPLEAMVVGAPVLYLRGALIDALNGHADVPGVCQDHDEMRHKAKALIAGDRDLSAAIRSSQGRVLEVFSAERAASQWAQLLGTVARP